MFFTLDTAKQDLRRRSYAEAMSDSSIASDSEPYRPPLIMPDEEVIAMFVVPSPPQVQEKKIQTRNLTLSCLTVKQKFGISDKETEAHKMLSLK